MHSFINRGFLFAVITLSAIPCIVAETISAEHEKFFEDQVRPLLADRCWSCHGAEEQEGGLRLDSMEAVTKGGDSGALWDAGNPTEGLLIGAIEYKSSEMPPDGKLQDEEIAILKRWIEIGTPWPRSEKDAAKRADDSSSHDSMSKQIESTIEDDAKTHWAFQPVVQPKLPPGDPQGWTRNEIDRFVWKHLRENDLRPSEPADRRTLMRRAYLDLIGMPPTPQEAKLFMVDDSDGAFERLVDRLLDDPRYGERWGRHWLDVARYADSKGAIFGEPRDYPFAYTYRDYVIAAFNSDKPFDRFLREQLAADQLTESENDPSLAALGFLTVHRRSNGGAKESQWVDRVDTVTRGMLGLTVACARCHDHKYDPVPTADFYSLLGVFAGIEEPEELPIIGQPDPDSQVARQYRQFLVEEDRKREEFIDENYRKLMKRVRGDVGRYLLAVHDARHLEDDKLRVLAGRRKLNPYITLRWKEYLEARPHDEVFGAWQALASLPEDQFAAESPSVLQRISDNELSDCRLNPVVAAAFQGKSPQSLKEVAEIYQAVFDSIETPVKTPDSKVGASDPHREQLRQCLYGKDSPGVIPAGNFKMLDRKVYLDLLKVEENRKLRLALHAGSPRRAMVVHDTKKPYKPYVFLRGNKDRRGPAVPRQFLEVLSKPDRKPFAHGSGRRELAVAITAPDNPLTSRVIVNRVWLWHFGKGLVATPSDFGLRSDPPSHPKLLDWLAAMFVQEGWSIKTLHRRIMNSATYQQSSHGDSAKFVIDPDNRLLWRYNRRRLDYEAIHDSMLAVSGKLDTDRGGPAVQMIRDAGWAKVSNKQTNWEFNPYRRAVYGVVDRDKLPPLLPTFDFASPDESASSRDITTVPTQSLYLMNSDFVMDLAAALAERSKQKGDDDPAERIRRLYELALNRSPSERELSLGTRFVLTVSEQARPGSTLQQLARQTMSAGSRHHVSPWEFGYAIYDQKAGTHDLSSMKTFPFLGPNTLQGSKSYPDKANGFGWLKLTRAGGHAAGGNRCVVRRWTSPINGTVTLSGTLKHPAEQGNGVQATIYCRAGQLGQWSAHHGEANTEISRVEVKRGDTIDFVVDSKADGGYDGFQWAPIVKEVRQKNREQRQGRTWNSSRDFPKPAPSTPTRTYGVWERYAQVLLMSNELMFVE